MPSILAAIFSSKISWTNNETTCGKACLVLSSRLSRNTKVKADWLDPFSKHFKLPNFCASSLATLISLAKKSRLTQRYGLIKFCSTWTGCPKTPFNHSPKQLTIQDFSIIFRMKYCVCEIVRVSVCLKRCHATPSQLSPACNRIFRSRSWSARVVHIAW